MRGCSCITSCRTLNCVVNQLTGNCINRLVRVSYKIYWNIPIMTFIILSCTGLISFLIMVIVSILKVVLFIYQDRLVRLNQLFEVALFTDGVVSTPQANE